MTWKFWTILAIVSVFGWGFYADYSVDIATYFLEQKQADIATAGSWGDTFGAFNGLVSLAGAVFIVRTLMLQQLSLAEQQKSLSVQAEDSHRQRFEATFFELLKLLRELRSELLLMHSPEFVNAAPTAARKAKRSIARSGTDALTGFVVELLAAIRSAVDDSSLATREDLASAFEATMTTRIERTFAPYFRLVYTILNRIRLDVVLKNEEKASYARLLRSQLTNTELFALAYNALSPRSADLESLLTEYRMLKYMPDKPGRRRFERIFDPKAFQPRD